MAVQGWGAGEQRQAGAAPPERSWDALARWREGPTIHGSVPAGPPRFAHAAAEAYLSFMRSATPFSNNGASTSLTMCLQSGHSTCREREGWVGWGGRRGRGRGLGPGRHGMIGALLNRCAGTAQGRRAGACSGVIFHMQAASCARAPRHRNRLERVRLGSMRGSVRAPDGAPGIPRPPGRRWSPRTP